MKKKNLFDIKKLFGQNILQHRRKLNISQEELAERAGLHRTYIGDIERGKRNISLINIVKLAVALEVNASDLLSEIAPPKDFFVG